MVNSLPLRISQESIDHSWVKFSQRSVCLGLRRSKILFEIESRRSVDPAFIRQLKYPRLWSIDFAGGSGKESVIKCEVNVYLMGVAFDGYLALFESQIKRVKEGVATIVTRMNGKPMVGIGCDR